MRTCGDSCRASSRPISRESAHWHAVDEVAAHADAVPFPLTARSATAPAPIRVMTASEGLMVARICAVAAVLTMVSCQCGGDPPLSDGGTAGGSAGGTSSAGGGAAGGSAGGSAGGNAGGSAGGNAGGSAGGNAGGSAGG